MGPPVRERFNDYVAGPLAKPVKKSVNAAANSVRKVTYAVFYPQMDNMKNELEHATAKGDAVLEWAKSTYASQSGKFYLFFVVLALWLVLSYVLWVNRRLSEVWALIHNGRVG